jgi:hypothetical protein
MSIAMAVVNLILGVVVDVAGQARDHLKQEIDDEKLVEVLQMHSHLLDICKQMDEDKNGELTREELINGYEKNENFRNILSAMDISEDDLEVLWTCLDEDKSGAVSYTEFVTSCYKLKTSNTHFMLAYIKYYICLIKNKICQDIAAVQKTLMEEEQRLEANMQDEQKKIEEELEKVEAEEHTIRTILEEQTVGVEHKNSPTKFQGPDVGTVVQELKELLGNVVSEIKELANVQQSKAADAFEKSDKYSSVQPLLRAAAKDSTDTTNQQQFFRMMMTMEEIKEKLDLRNPQPWVRSVPQEHWPASFGCCDSRSSQVKVHELPSSLQRV